MRQSTTTASHTGSSEMRGKGGCQRPRFNALGGCWLLLPDRWAFDRATISMSVDRPIRPKIPEKPKQPFHPGSGMKPRKQRNPSAERLASLYARGDVKVMPCK